MEKISIIVPIYNAEKYLKRCVDSILSQTYPQLEVILVDDGSPDRSGEICDNYAKIDSRVVVLHKENGGVSAARNDGINCATGAWIGFVDADDYLEENMYETLMAVLAAYPADACGLAKVYTNDGILITTSISASVVSGLEAIKALLQFQFPTSLWSFIYHASLLDGLLLKDDIHFWEDYEFQFRVFTRAQKIALCQDPLYHYIQHEGSINRQKMNDKILSCLKISNPIERYISEHFPDLQTQAEIIELKFFCCVFYHMTNSAKVDTQYDSLLQKEARRIQKQHRHYKNATIKERIILSTCALNAGGFRRFYLLCRALKARAYKRTI